MKNKFKGIAIAMLIPLILNCVTATEGSSTTVKDDIEKAWKLDFKDINLDPKNWTPEFKSKMLMIAVICIVALNYAYKLSVVAAVGLFSFGLVKISWPLVVGIAVSLYGYKTKRMVFLAAGLACSYALAFGVSLV